ncbi:MAG: fluoride efflux transporter CrcB [Nitrospinae bacterium]|nr:fluoride efflux transporter CrcB [Nitrospinota bacterium]
MSQYMAVALGGAIGSSLRYFVSGAVYEKFGAAFPYGTLAVNIIGCFFIGLLMEMAEARFTMPPQIKLLLTVGVLGGFTTFSTFSFETLALMRDGMAMKAAVNIIGTVAICLTASWAGMVAGRIV